MPPSSIILPDVDIGEIQSGNPSRARSELGIPPSVPVIAMLARPEPFKGHADLVRAAAVVRESIPDVRVVLTTGWSSPGFASELRTFVEQLGLSEAVRLPGGISSSLRADLLAASSVVAHPSWIEPFGLAMLEGMVAGKPVVAASTDGSRYLIEDGVTGLIVPPRRPEQLAAALIEVLQDPERARRMGEAGRKRAAAIADGRMVERIQSVWTSVL